MGFNDTRKKRIKQKLIASMIDNPKIFYPFLTRSKMGKDAKRHSAINKTLHVAGEDQEELD